jgi:hypothetical protein
MTQQQSTQPAPDYPRSTRELLARIQHSRLALERILAALTEAQMTTPGPTGWTIKDHLAHLAVWEWGIVALLNRQPRFAAMNLDAAVVQGMTEEEINEVIYQQHAALSLAQVREQLDTAEREMRQALGRLDDQDLLKPYASFLPEGSAGRQDPVLYAVAGNTYEHYDEHREYIQREFGEIAGA